MYARMKEMNDKKKHYTKTRKIGGSLDSSFKS